jgi:methylenetetrahydrofolate dehydrogenase (NADP+) / methenyltetrahydrofolate cyclohydrolase
VALTLRTALAVRITALAARGVRPQLATVTVGEDPQTAGYMARKHADCVAIGLPSRDLRLPATTSEAQLLDHVRSLNEDPAVTAFTVQLPVPDAIDEERLILACDPGKDADGKHPLNLGRLFWGHPGPLPCTAAAVLALLRAYDVSLRGRRVLLIGRGFFTGSPLMLLLSRPGVDAVVTVAHRQAGDLDALLRESDVVISAAGVPGLVTAASITPGAVVVGVGISYVAGKMVSDVADDVAAVASHVTPRQGSVGPLTRAMLIENTVRIAEAQ